MSTHKWILAAGLIASTSAFGAETPNLGKPITPAELAAWNITVMPDGKGLPAGSGTAAQGAAIFAQKCIACHAPNAGGGLAAGLIGAPPKTSLDGGKTIANYW